MSSIFLLLFVHLQLLHFLHDPKANYGLLVAYHLVVNALGKVKYPVQTNWKEPRVAKLTQAK